MRFGDETGLFWNDPVRERASKSSEPRAMPPVPDTGWELPTQFPNLRGQGMLSLDVESKDPFLLTKGPGYIRGDAHVVGVAVGTEAGYRQYFPVAHEGWENLPKERVYNWLQEQLHIVDVPIVGANLRYDIEALTFEGLEVPGPFYDVQVAEPLLDENRFSYQLETLARDYLDEGKEVDAMYLWLKDAFGAKNIKGNIWRAPPAVVGPYAESDVDLPLRIFRLQKKKMEEQGLWDLFIMESKLIPILIKMRLRGVRVDLSAAEQLRDTLRKKQEATIHQIKLATGVDVDLWSADSLARVFDKVGLPYARTQKTNKPSFTKGSLDHVKHPVAKQLLEARHYDKFCGTFIEGYILDGNVGGRLHTQFNQLRSDDSGAVSGRFSSSGPNLQNIPTRGEEGQLIRAMFIPDEGKLWWSLDWSQIEYRLIVHYAYLMGKRGAAEVVQRYMEDGSVDYHQIVADMTNLSRDNAKTLNFGLAYGQGVQLLCSNLGVDVETGRGIIANYHNKAPYIRPLMKSTSERVESRGYITTLLGRRRRFVVWEKRTPKGMVYSQEPLPGYKLAKLHKSLNALIQGSAADLMKKAMVDIEESGVCDVLGYPGLTVHDELDGDMEDTPIAREALAEVKNIMETCVTLSIPLIADLGIGKHWAEAKG